MRIEIPGEIEIPKELIEFKSKIDKQTIIDSITNCWLYQGHINDVGYGLIAINYEKQRVHRISAAIYLNYDLLDKTLQVNHKCDSKNCWNPSHLYIGTQLDNIQDTVGTRTPKTHCPRGHEYIPENTYVNPKGDKICKICRREIDRIRRINGKI